jgi:hypothetical protein
VVRIPKPVNSSGVVKKVVNRQSKKNKVYEESQERAEKILEGCNPVQRRFIKDSSKRKAGRCPRRSGKTFAASSLALEQGERKAGSRTLIISLTLKSTKENYWTRSPGGIHAQNERYDLGLKFNLSAVTWEHQNGSKGMLAGAETRADIERLRGSTAEADLIIIDECKSFPPALLKELIREVVEPGLMTRSGTLVLIGTPGAIPEGPFYEYTEPKYTDHISGKPKCKLFDGKPVKLRDRLYSLHTWTIQDNEAIPEQWENALAFKDQNGWSDDNPTWRREYLGEWVTDTDELVYAYAKCKPYGNVSWTPDYKLSQLGFDLNVDGPWNLVMGLDFGYEDANAIVLAAYSETLKELRHVYSFKESHMSIDDFGQEIAWTIKKFGQPHIIVGDKGSLGGVLYLQELNSRFGLGIVEAEKREKYDHIELLNSDFLSGRIKIIPDSELDKELTALQWDLSKDDKKYLIRTGKLREDPSCANHLCDSLLYLWRYCYHYWSEPSDGGPEPGTVEYWRRIEADSVQRYKDRLMAEYLKRERELGDYDN